MSDVDIVTGTRIARVLERLLRGRAADAPMPSDEVWQVVADHSSDVPAGWQRMRVRQGLYLAAESYLRSFRPGFPWELVGSEVPLGRARVDLLWRARPADSDVALGDVLIDELKLQISRGPLSPRLRAQLALYLTEGERMFGHRFVGIRLISLANTDRSRLIATSRVLCSVARQGPRARPDGDSRAVTPALVSRVGTSVTLTPNTGPARSRDLRSHAPLGAEMEDGHA